MINVAPAIENTNNKSNHLQTSSRQQSHTDRQTDRRTFKLKKRGIIIGDNLPLLIRLSVSSLSTTATHNFLNSPVEKAPQKEGPPLPETLANPYLQPEDANDINKQDKKPIEDCGDKKKQKHTEAEAEAETKRPT
jgi:hypothetical protein